VTELTCENDINLYLERLKARDCRSIAFDIEGEFNLHCYGEHLCLIQIFDGSEEIIIDPLRFENTAALKKVLEKKDLLKIMYDAAGDSALLMTTHNIKVNSVLDLRPAVSLLQYQKQSLSEVLRQEFDIQGRSKKKFQMHNWMRRPLAAEALDYALDDVRHLFKLKDALYRKLLDSDLMDEFLLSNLIQPSSVKKIDKTAAHKRAKGYNRLTREQRETFRKIFIIRDKYARLANKPPHLIFPNQKLMALAAGDFPAAERFVDHIFKGLKPSLKSELAINLQQAL
jgi:ribonuclease D